MTADTVKVTAGHISRGEQREPDACPIALALRDLHPGATIDVYNSFAVIFTGPAAADLTASLPPKASEFVEAFDHGEDVEPLEFQLTWQTREETELEIEVSP